MKEDDRGGELASSPRADSALVRAGGERSLLLEVSEAVFNQMAGWIAGRSRGAGLAALRLGGHHTGHARLREQVQAAFWGSVSLICQPGLALLDSIGAQRLRALEVRGVARRERQAERIPEGLARRRELRTQAASGAAAPCRSWVPPFAPAAC